MQMSLGIQALRAFTPITLSGLLLIGLGRSAKRAMPLVYLVTALIALVGALIMVSMYVLNWTDPLLGVTLP